MPTSAAVRSPADLRLMPFGQTKTKEIHDGLWEPLWRGRRVLVDVLDGRVTIRDEHNEPADGFESLREALVAACLADEVVLDGYLMPGPLSDGGGADSLPGMDAMPSASEMSRQLILGGGGSRRDRREEFSEGRGPRVQLPPSSPIAFVAVDLLWIDGEPIIDVPLLERKRQLDAVLVDGPDVRRTVAVRPPVEAWFAQWRALGFREIAVKAANSRYTPGKPNGEWAMTFIPKG
ncbi:MAG TPA: hypothetical protein VFO50_04100 [Candidatus Limnocylindrales bacterium]|nr:hypothetical protein [Candidatus Limnocylindrales bacterium]